jgi:hypothetical protein
MKDLRVGDKILSVKNNKVAYDTVYGFLHRDVDKVANFIEIHLESGNCLTLTPSHMVYREDKTAVPARKICVGDALFVVSGNDMNLEIVTDISSRESKGIYAPVTYGGNIVVDGVWASCYAEYEIFKSQTVAHSVMAPLRMKTKITGLDKKDRRGVNPYCKFLAYGVSPFTRIVR